MLRYLPTILENLRSTSTHTRKCYLEHRAAGPSFELRSSNMSVNGTKLEYIYIAINIKGKAVPIQAWSDPEGSRKLRFPDYVTVAQDGGKVVSLTHRPL